MLASLVIFLCPFQAGPVIELPAGAPIVLDGKLNPAEWEPAFSISRTIEDDHKVRMVTRRAGAWLALGLSADRAYDGELGRITVCDEAGSWICMVILSLGHVHMPPAIWRRGSPLAMADPKVRPECPRGVRARVHAGAADGWSAEYMVRLSTLGIGHADRRRFKISFVVFKPGRERRDLIVVPEKAITLLDTEHFARLRPIGGWGESEQWPPVPTAISREFDDHALLFRLFLEHDRIAQRLQADQLVISNAVRPRSATRINMLRRSLQEARKRNPSLPAWHYYLGRLLHEGNYFAEARALIDAVPEPLAKLAPWVNLRAEHYNDTEEPDKALEFMKGRPDVPRALETVRVAQQIKQLQGIEKQALAADAKKQEKNPRVRIVVADKGAIVCELFEDDAPRAVRNFIDLVGRKFYDHLAFSDVGGQIARTGDPRTRPGAVGPMDNPGWRLRPDARKRPLLRGRLATVPTHGELFHGSEFLISVVPLPMESKLVVFGRVVEGMDVVDHLEQDDRIDKIEVISKRNHAYDPLEARLR